MAKKSKHLSDTDVDTYRHWLDKYEKLTKKMQGDGITFKQYEEWKAVKKWVKTILWVDRHNILLAHETILRNLKLRSKKTNELPNKNN